MKVAPFVNPLRPPIHDLSSETDSFVYDLSVEKKARRFASFAEAEKADRDYYKKLTGNERLQICVELSAPEVDQPMERVVRIRKFSELSEEDP